jgi:hypothetical protein
MSPKCFTALSMIVEEKSLKALSLWQAWATLVALGDKRYETRSWSTKYRGPVLIHASKYGKELTWCFANPAYRSALTRAGYTNPLQLPLGMALCVVDLVDVIRTEQVQHLISEQERAFGNYADQRFAWKFENLRAFDEQIPMRGAQGLFNVEASYLPAIKAQLRQWHLQHGAGLVECSTCGRSAAADKDIHHTADCGDPQRVEVTR